MLEEEKAFIRTKASIFFKKENEIEFNANEVEFDMQRLSGISNLIFKVQILSDKHKFEVVDTVFFKIFGRISSK
jgi:hypothetical protein